jgi:ketosteroid isomerase-like protein
MPPDPLFVLQSLYAALTRGDIAGALAWCHKDIVFTSNVHPELGDRPVELVGAAAIRDYLALVKSRWEVDKAPGKPKPLDLQPGEPREGGTVYNVTVRVSMRHRETGEIFVGSKRQEWVISNGRVSAMAQYLDRDKIMALQQLAALA